MSAETDEPVVPYGEWPSPLTIDLLLSGASSVTDVRVDQGELWWSEARPEEDGRIAIVRRLGGGTTVELTPASVSVRTRAHEYGGGAWWVDAGTLFYVDWVDQRLYRLDPGAQPAAITPKQQIPAGDRFADGVLTPDRHWVICVREQHRVGWDEARNEIVAIPSYGGAEPTVLASGSDFVSSPVVSTDGKSLAWVRWNHPAMPWDATELCVAELTSTMSEVSCGAPEVVAGGPDTSVIQPNWQPDGALLFMSDQSGWWNLYRRSDDATVTNLAPVDADLAGPQWVFGLSDYAVTDDGSIAVAHHHDGIVGLARIVDGAVEPLETGLASVSHLRPLVGGIGPSDFERSSIVAIGADASTESTVVQVSLAGGPDSRAVPLRDRRVLDLPTGLFSTPEHITFTTPGGAVAHGLFYEPANPAVAAPDGARPPLLVAIHGGPTGAARAMLSLEMQFWTTRGFAVVDVNYRGSTGYGRVYRNELQGQWGVADVADCVAAAQYLADADRVDGDRLAIRGGSAGGFTTLAALATTDVFDAGTNKYGVADLGALARDTHKFESRYLDGLVGPWPEAEARYIERSPLTHVDAISCPLLVLQGSEDVIVPPDQSETIVDAVRSKGIPVAYLLFEGEQHGFRRAETIRAALEAELAFYGKVFGFDPADPLPELDLR